MLTLIASGADAIFLKNEICKDRMNMLNEELKLAMAQN